MMPRSGFSSPVLMLSHLHLLVLLLTCGLLPEVAEAQECPNECSCFGRFVSCYQFTEQSLRNLPTGANTIVLNGGDINSFPSGFAKQFPLLTLLDIQSTNMKTIRSDTFSGLKGLDQVAMTDCQIGSIETGAFEDISAVSQILISGSEIGAIRPRAFSGLSNIREFSIWSTTIGRVESGAFSGFSNFSSFAFYLNNVTTLNRNVFVDIENLGKVDVYMNRISNAKGGAVMPLQAATNDMNMYSNTFPCNCGIVRDFNAPLLKPYLVSQKCVEDGQVFRLSEVNVDEICSGQPSSSPSSSTSTLSTTRRSTSTPEVVTPSFESTTPIKVTQIVHITTTPQGGNERTTSPTPAFRSSSTTSSGGSTSVSGQRSTEPGVTKSGTGHSSGQTGDSSNPGSGARGWGTQLLLVPCVTTVLAITWLASV